MAITTAVPMAVMVAMPGVTPWTLALVTGRSTTVATPVADVLQVTVSVMFWVVPSLNVPVAVSWTMMPAATLGLAGRDGDGDQRRAGDGHRPDGGQVPLVVASRKMAVMLGMPARHAASRGRSRRSSPDPGSSWPR